MSNFDFMNSGLLESDGGAYENSFHEYITALLSLFITKSLENAVKYIDICNRNGITKNDIELALKHQAFEFFKNPNLADELEDIKKAMLEDYDSEDEDEVELVEEAEEGEGEEAETICEGDSEEIEAEECEAEEIEAEEVEGEEAEEVEAEEAEGETECEGDEEFGIVNIEDLFNGMNVDDENVQQFERVNLRDVEIEKRNFVRDFHTRTDNWETWTPQNDIEKSIFNAIETMTSRF